MKLRARPAPNRPGQKVHTTMCMTTFASDPLCSAAVTRWYARLSAKITNDSVAKGYSFTFASGEKTTYLSRKGSSNSTCLRRKPNTAAARTTTPSKSTAPAPSATGSSARTATRTWDRTNNHIWCPGCQRQSENGADVTPEHWEVHDRKPTRPFTGARSRSSPSNPFATTTERADTFQNPGTLGFQSRAPARTDTRPQRPEHRTPARTQANEY